MVKPDDIQASDPPPPWRRIIVCGVVGLTLIVVGLFASPWLILLGAILVVVGPLGYAMSDALRHPPRQPERRYDAIGDDIQRMIERAGPRGDAERRPRPRDR